MSRELDDVTTELYRQVEEGGPSLMCQRRLEQGEEKDSDGRRDQKHGEGHRSWSALKVSVRPLYFAQCEVGSH